jgi:NAD(P)-dependent dehydrogenase (short-subunit alcohol dehydrogenase family)
LEVRLDGKVAVITGGSRGIGNAIAKEFLNSGAEGVVVTSRRSEAAQEAAEALGQATRRPDAVIGIGARADRKEDADRCVAETIDRFGACDVLINNAGTNPAVGNLSDVDLDAMDKTWLVNQKGPIIWAQAAWHGWMKDHGGVILNTASVGGMNPGPMLGAYNISKAALLFTTRQLALEMAPGVRVNALAPAVVKTKLSELLWKDAESAAAAMHPLGRLGEPEDIAAAAVFLCSDKASWITGVNLPVDGGSSGASASLG